MIKRNVGVKWKIRSKMSMGFVKIPFFSIIIFSITCGMGRKGASNMKIAATIRRVKGILSKKARILIFTTWFSKIRYFKISVCIYFFNFNRNTALEGCVRAGKFILQVCQ